MDGLTTRYTGPDQATMCKEYGIIIGEQPQPYRPAIECHKKPPGATARDCPDYMFLLLPSDHRMSFSSSPSFQIGGTGVGSIGTGNGGDNPSFGSGGPGGKDTGGNDRAYSAGYLSRLRKGLPSWKSGEPGGKGTGNNQDTGGSSTAAASGKKTT